MKRKNYDTVTEAMTDLKKLGYTIDFSIGNFTLTNQSYNESLLHITYNYTFDKNSTGNIWNWWDLNSCSNRFELPYYLFISICSDCVVNPNSSTFDNYNLIVE